MRNMENERRLNMNKVVIKETPNADSRTMEGKELDRDLIFEDTKSHIKGVQDIMEEMSNKLLDNSKRHDFTKIKEFDGFFDMLSELVTNGHNVNGNKWWELHITDERHHVLNKEPKDVNLFDILELIADVNASGMARTGEVYDIQMPGDLLIRAFNNTMRMVKNSIEVEKVTPDE